MNRKKFLYELRELWKENGEVDSVLTLEDLLDDAATLGLEGAGDIYLKSVLDETRDLDRG